MRFLCARDTRGLPFVIIRTDALVGSLAGSLVLPIDHLLSLFTSPDFCVFESPVFPCIFFFSRSAFLVL